MELISREEAMEAIRAIKEVMLTNGEVINALYHVPTIESRPKGKWLRKEYYFDEWVDECSVCGEAYVMIDGTATENGYNYCPNCGAYMVADVRGEE